jgi:Zn-dependent peptidase ImmA (M78 family)
MPTANFITALRRLMQMNKERKLLIEKNAENVRIECGVTEYGFKDIFEASEKIGYRDIRYPIGADALLGFSLIKDSDRIIFSNSSLILSREIFSVAHEIGHQRLHLTESEKTLIKDDDFNDRDEFEIEANFFAACLLMPKDKVDKYIRLELNYDRTTPWAGLDIARIQTAFNVSYDMVLVRLKELGYLNESTKENLKIEKIERTATKLLNVIGGNVDLCQPSEVKRIPAEFLEWVISNYSNKLIPRTSLQTALHFVDLDTEDFVDTSGESEDEDDLDDLIREMD